MRASPRRRPATIALVAATLSVLTLATTATAATVPEREALRADPSTRSAQAAGAHADAASTDAASTVDPAARPGAPDDPSVRSGAGRFTAVPTTRAWQGTVGTTPQRIPIAGIAGVPAEATAVVVNVEVSGPTAAGYIRVTPAGQDPQVATQAFTEGRKISNLATVRLVDGAIQAKVSRGSATVFMDVSGYYTETTGATYTPVPNARVFGERVGTTPTRIPVAGRGGVPADATAVVATVGLEQQTAAGYVRVTPAGHDAQVASQTFPADTAISGLVTVGLRDGAVQAKVSRGSAQLWFDVAGYYSASASGSVFVPIDTSRVASSDLTAAPGSVRLAGVSGIPGTATAVVANVEVKDPTRAGYVRVTPAGTDAQVALQSFAAGQTVSSLSITQVTGSTTDRRVQAKVSRGTARAYFDVAGYFVRAPGSATSIEATQTSRGGNVTRSTVEVGGSE